MKIELIDVPQPMFQNYDGIHCMETFRIRESRGDEVWVKMADGDSFSLMSGMTLERDLLMSKALIMVESVGPIQFKDAVKPIKTSNFIADGAE